MLFKTLVCYRSNMLCPAWLDRDGDGQWRPRRGRIAAGFYDLRAAHVAAAEIVKEYVEGAHERERIEHERRNRGVSFRELAHSYLVWARRRCWREARDAARPPLHARRARHPLQAWGRKDRRTHHGRARRPARSEDHHAGDQRRARERQRDRRLAAHDQQVSRGHRRRVQLRLQALHQQAARESREQRRQAPQA